MLPEILERYNEGILAEANKAFGIDPKKQKSLGGFEAEVYEYSKSDKSYILKITHSLRRTTDYLMGELEFVNTLREAGLPGCSAVPSPAGRLIETVDDGKGGYFLAYSFEKADGDHIKPAQFDEKFVKNLGALMAQMHKVAKSYVPSSTSYRRIDFLKEDIFELERWIPEEEELAMKQARAVLNKSRSLSEESNVFGLIHGDLHMGNFFMDGDTIVAFDFDDASYSHYANDIAVAMYYTFRDKWNKGTNPDHYRWLLDAFMDGYSKHFSLPQEQVDLIPHFFKLRDLVMYVVLLQCGSEEIDQKEYDDMIAAYGGRLKQGICWLDL